MTDYQNQSSDYFAGRTSPDNSPGRTYNLGQSNVEGYTSPQYLDQQQTPFVGPPPMQSPNFPQPPWVPREWHGPFDRNMR